MPGRATEVGTIRWCNTRTAMQNVFVQHGQLLVIVEYQKAQRRTQHSFFVVQALPLLVSQLFFNYLAFVQPFAAALSSQINRNPSENTPYIFVTKLGVPFQANQLTAALKKHSTEHCIATLTVASYRQVVLAIAKRHIAPLAGQFNGQRPEHTSQLWRIIA
jgi:hypothetical protein